MLKRICYIKALFMIQPQLKLLFYVRTLFGSKTPEKHNHRASSRLNFDLRLHDWDSVARMCYECNRVNRD